MNILTSAQVVFIIAAIVIGTALLYGLFTLISVLVRMFASPSDSEPSLLEQVQANAPAKSSFAQVDRDFDRMVHGTMFGFGSDRAAEIILLAAGCSAVGVYALSLSWIAALGIGLAGALLPLGLIYVFRNRWRTAIQEQLPDACFQLARCMRAGLTIEGSFKETASYSQEPIAEVFRKGARLIEGGMTTPNTVQRIADDVRLSDFDTMTAILALQTDVGGNLPLILDRLATAIRDRNQYRGYYRSVTALSRLTALIVAVAGPFLGLIFYFYQPELFMNFIDMPLGNLLLAAAAILWFVGVIWIIWLLSGRDQF